VNGRAALAVALAVAGILAASAAQLPPDPRPAAAPPPFAFSDFIPPKP
jgi:hypothetical protein